MKRLPPRGPGRPARRAGFTLVELLVAMTVFTLLAATAYAGLRTSASSWERSEALISRWDERRAVVNFLRRQLAQTAPLARIERRRWHLWFEGSPDSLVFLSELPGYVGEGGVHELGLALDRGEQGQGLYLRRQPLDAEAELGEFAAEQVLQRRIAADIDRIEFAYFGRPEGRGEPRWHDRWSENRRLPTLVKVTITPAQGDPWPTLQVRLRSDAIRFLRRPGRAQGGTTEEESVAPVSIDEEDESDGNEAEGDAAPVLEPLREVIEQVLPDG